MKSIKLTASLIFLSTVFSLAQYAPYPRDYFMFPIRPGHRNFLSGNMGELRTNHFHGGLDIKTNMETGWPVHACADGYVSRVAVAHKGYGNTLYITHPNGLSTVYAHLEWFSGAIGKYVKDHLYKEQCNEIDMELPKDLLYVKKGEVVAWSGNTGSSGGPHLHWEIRDEQERLLNPLFFEFNEIEDVLPPFINKFAIRTLDIDSRIEGEFGRMEFIPAKQADNYILRYPIHAFGTLGIELVAYDKMNGTHNFYGISQIETFFDGKLIFSHDIQKIGFDENPFINVHIDYATAVSHHNLFQRCYRVDGNELHTYNEKLNGKIIIRDSLVHDVNIKVMDAHRNSTMLNFKIKGTQHATFKPELKSKASHKVVSNIKHHEYENILKLDIIGSKDKNAAFYFKGNKILIPPSYIKNMDQVYLWDMRKSLPDSVEAGTMKQKFNFQEAIPSVNAINYAHKHLDITFPKRSVFDTLFLSLGYFKGIYSLHRTSIPLFSYLIVTLKPETDIPNKAKTAVYNVTGRGSLRYSGGQWKGNSIKFSTKIFGDFTLKTDTVPPKISFHKKIGNKFYYKMTDNLSGVAQWYAYLNGKFLLMHYETKFGVIITDPLASGEIIKGDLLIGAIDNMGNKTIATFSIR